MANGRPGDHPYTDVIHHGSAVFGEEIDNLLREIHRRWGLLKEVEELTWDNDPRWSNVAFDADSVLAQLNAIKLRLERDHN
jgi:hypothetical protein